MSPAAFRVSHVGNLPRPLDLQQMMTEQGNLDGEVFTGRLRSAIDEVVKRQITTGIQIVNDGEYSKRKGFSTYVDERLTGIKRDDSFGLPPFSNFEPRPDG